MGSLTAPQPTDNPFASANGILAAAANPKATAKIIADLQDRLERATAMEARAAAAIQEAVAKQAEAEKAIANAAEASRVRERETAQLSAQRAAFAKQQNEFDIWKAETEDKLEDERQIGAKLSKQAADDRDLWASRLQAAEAHLAEARSKNQVADEHLASAIAKHDEADKRLAAVTNYASLAKR